MTQKSRCDNNDEPGHHGYEGDSVDQHRVSWWKYGFSMKYLIKEFA